MWPPELKFLGTVTVNSYTVEWETSSCRLGYIYYTHKRFSQAICGAHSRAHTRSSSKPPKVTY